MSDSSPQILQKALLNETLHNLGLYPSQLARVFHGRGSAFEGLESINIEWYPPHLFVQCYAEELPEGVANTLLEIFEQKTSIETIVVQTRPWPKVANAVLCSRANTECELPFEFATQLTEDLQCNISLGKNRNTGVFPDMRSGWDWVNQNVSGKRVLNLFSYTGIFSLFALNGGAAKVVNIDMCGSSVKTAQRNHQHNDMNDERVSFWKRDILKSNNQISKQSNFDLIILDPPPFQKGSFNGWGDYQKLLRRCRNYLKDDGQILAALNNQQVTREEFIHNVQETISIKNMEILDLAEEIKEANSDKGLKLALICLEKD